MISSNVSEIAKIQGALFEYSCKNSNCSSSFFIKQFLYSSISQMINNPYFIYSTNSVKDLYEMLEQEKKLNVGKTIYPEAVMYWIGYLLAVMGLTKKISPDQIYKIISPKELYLSYEAYHSLSIEDAIERILQSKTPVKNDLALFKEVREKFEKRKEF